MQRTKDWDFPLAPTDGPVSQQVDDLVEHALERYEQRHEEVLRLIRDGFAGTFECPPDSVSLLSLNEAAITCDGLTFRAKRGMSGRWEWIWVARLVCPSCGRTMTCSYSVLSLTDLGELLWHQRCGDVLCVSCKEKGA